MLSYMFLENFFWWVEVGVGRFWRFIHFAISSKPGFLDWGISSYFERQILPYLYNSWVVVIRQSTRKQVLANISGLHRFMNTSFRGIASDPWDIRPPIRKIKHHTSLWYLPKYFPTKYKHFSKSDPLGRACDFFKRDLHINLFKQTHPRVKGSGWQAPRFLSHRKLLMTQADLPTSPARSGQPCATSWLPAHVSSEFLL